ncbi:MAG TPA: hypothetical protein VFN37_14300, partial [Candidatus Baltobacteraceae bacterium]|nr:hypothetical protein [Candidatus Baltobacteraceae bacterium]
MMRALKWLFALILIAVIAGGAWFAYTIWGDRSHPQTAQQIIVPQGSSFRDIALQLANAGIVSNAPAFRMYAKMVHGDTAAHAGAFRFAPHQTAA